MGIITTIPIWVLFLFTLLIIALAVELGFRIGSYLHKKSKFVKESPVSVISASILGMLAFILAFTFGMVADRHSARRELVRNEASAIRTAWLRTDFLPESERKEAIGLLKRYLDLRINAVHSSEIDQLQKSLDESVAISNQLWKNAVVNAERDMNSDVASLYLESLNEIININSLRVSFGLQIHLPEGIWLVLYILIILSMIALGYQIAIAESERTWSTLILALSFSIIVVLIESIDRPNSTFIPVPQQALLDLQRSMNK
ncbi:MAG TPA: DUF4239 domain-containing protein [Flavobacterium sp.]|nr:DUF4239 domain-containing protein [Flavobacterium sp.]